VAVGSGVLLTDCVGSDRVLHFSVECVKHSFTCSLSLLGVRALPRGLGSLHHTILLIQFNVRPRGMAVPISARLIRELHCSPGAGPVQRALR